MEEAIMQAAESLLAEVGQDFTMEQLEARLDVSRATLYRHIGSKRKLLARLAQERGEALGESDRRRDILEAARVVFSQQGLASATMEAVADEAGVGVATVYRHFGDKQSLFHAFVEEMTPRPAIRDYSLNPTGDVAADLRRIVGIMLPFFYENRDVFRLMFMGSAGERRAFQQLRAGSDSSLAYLAGYFQAQLDAGRLRVKAQAEELALAFMGLLLGFSLIGPLHYDRPLDDLRHSGRLVVDLFLHDLRESRP